MYSERLSVVTKCASFLLFFWLSTMSLHSEVYFLKDLVNHGLNNSTNIIRSQNTILNTRDSRLSTYLEILPNASASISYTNPSRADSYFSSGMSIGRSIALNEPTYFNLRRSSLDRRIVDLNHENLRKRTALEILFAYIDIIQQQQNVKITNENINLQRRIHEQTIIQFSQGRKTIHELQQSQLDTLNTYIQLLELNNALERQRENLFFLIKLEDRGYPLENFQFTINDERPIRNESDNLNIQSSELRLQRSRHSLTQQYLSLFPSLSASFNWSAGFVDRHFSNEFVNFNNYNESSTFSVNLSYPLFNQFNQGLNFRMARRNFNLEKLELQELTEETNQQINQLIQEIERLKQAYDLHKQRHELAQITLQIAEERFVLGIISHLDLDRARIQYLEAEFQLVNRFYTLVKRQEELNFAQSNKILGIW